MANQEHLEILKQGVEAWNTWRAEHPNVETDFKEATLREADLVGANLSGVNFRRAYLSGAKLADVDLRGADLRGAKLLDADLRRAQLSEANLSATDLREANLRNADLWGTDLTGADLGGVNLSGARLRGSKISHAIMVTTVIVSTDLTDVIGLEDVVHKGPSDISTSTLSLSEGKMPDTFLRGCGLSDWEIESVKLFNPDLSNEEINRILYKMYDLRATQALQISPLFISYSHADAAFVDRVGECLTKKGIRYWRDIHDMKAGRMEKQIDRAIRQNPTVLLILSEHSLSSDWVEHEVRTARSLEKEMRRDVICPVALDDGWKNSPWAKRIMEQVMEYNILDFSEWKDDTKFESAFSSTDDGRLTADD